MERNLVSQSFPAGIIMSNDVDVEDDVDSDVDDTDVINDVEEEDEDEKASSFRSRMMTQQKSSSTASRSLCIRIADLSHTLRQSVQELQLDVDGDGQLDTDEILSAVKHLTTQTKTHASLRKIVGALCAFLLLLVVCVFASTLTAARLVKDTTLDPISGIMYAKGGNAHKIMKTEAVAIYSNSTTTLSQMNNADLDLLKAILPGTGDMKFQVKGYARKADSEEEVQILVEGGGTITYDRKGITAATGNAKVLLAFAYGGDGDVLDDASTSNTHYLSYGPHDVYVSGG